MVREPDLLATLDLSSVREISIGSAPLTDALLDQVAKVFPTGEGEERLWHDRGGSRSVRASPRGACDTRAVARLPDRRRAVAFARVVTRRQGVLELRTPALMSGYLNLAETTLTTYTRRLVRHWRCDAPGFQRISFILSAVTTTCLFAAARTSTGEVEKLLERHPDVAQAAVVPAPDDIKGAIPVAFVVLALHAVPSSASIKQFALQHGPAYAHPRSVVFRNELPMSGTRKIERAALTAEAAHITKEAGRAS